MDWQQVQRIRKHENKKYKNDKGTRNPPELKERYKNISGKKSYHYSLEMENVGFPSKEEPLKPKKKPNDILSHIMRKS